MTEYKVGDKVRFIDEEAHKRVPDYFPEVGTIGIVQKTDRDGDLIVQWPAESTKGQGRWFTHPTRVIAAESTTPCSRASLLAAAEKCVCHDRNDQYGPVEDNFSRIARYWTLWLDGRVEVTAHDVGCMMALLKLARVQSRQVKADNYIDGIGYLACAGEIALKEDGTQP